MSMTEFAKVAEGSKDWIWQKAGEMIKLWRKFQNIIFLPDWMKFHLTRSDGPACFRKTAMIPDPLFQTLLFMSEFYHMTVDR